MRHFVFAVVDVMFKGQQEFLLAAFDSLHASQARPIWWQKDMDVVVSRVLQGFKAEMATLYVRKPQWWEKPEETYLFSSGNHFYWIKFYNKVREHRPHPISAQNYLSTPYSFFSPLSPFSHPSSQNPCSPFSLLCLNTGPMGGLIHKCSKRRLPRPESQLPWFPPAMWDHQRHFRYPNLWFQ